MEILDEKFQSEQTSKWTISKWADFKVSKIQSEQFHSEQTSKWTMSKWANFKANNFKVSKLQSEQFQSEQNLKWTISKWANFKVNNFKVSKLQSEQTSKWTISKWANFKVKHFKVSKLQSETFQSEQFQLALKGYLFMSSFVLLNPICDLFCSIMRSSSSSVNFSSWTSLCKLTIFVAISACSLAMVTGFLSRCFAPLTKRHQINKLSLHYL